MKRLLLGLIFIPFSCLSQNFKIFDSTNIDIVLSLSHGDSNIYFCYAANAYIDSVIYGVNNWYNFIYRDYAYELDTSCMPFLNYYLEHVNNNFKTDFSFDCNCFTHIYDSAYSDKYDLFVYKTGIKYYFMEDTLKKSNSTFLHKEYKNTIYVGFKAKASGIIVDDPNKICFRFYFPSMGFHKYINCKQELIPSIFISNIQNCSQFEIHDLEKFRFIRMNKDTIRFIYQDQ